EKGRAGHDAPQRRIETILSRREQLMAEIGSLSESPTHSRFIDNARQLLTRWWATANWNGREDLLRTAEWAVRIAKQEAVGPRPPVKAPASRASRGANRAPSRHRNRTCH